jgi:hypothetical protein
MKNLIEKALKNLGIKYEGDEPLESKADIKRLISIENENIEEAKLQIIALNNAIDTTEENIRTLEELLHEVELEEFRKNNPNLINNAF